jgi:hypothetical protein
MQTRIKGRRRGAFSRSPLLHPDTLSWPLRTSLHLLDTIPTSIRTRLGIVTLRVPLLTSKAELLVLLGALVVWLAVASAAAALFAIGLGIVVEGDVEEVFFVGVCDFGALALCWEY